MSELTQAAAEIARLVRLPRTWPTIKTIEVAISSEADYSQVSLSEAAAIIADAAVRDRRQGRDVNRFYFEDARWAFPKLNRAEQVQENNRRAAEAVEERYRQQAQEIAEANRRAENSPLHRPEENDAANLGSLCWFDRVITRALVLFGATERALDEAQRYVQTFGCDRGLDVMRSRAEQMLHENPALTKAASSSTVC